MGRLVVGLRQIGCDGVLAASWFRWFGEHASPHEARALEAELVNRLAGGDDDGGVGLAYEAHERLPARPPYCAEDRPRAATRQSSQLRLNVQGERSRASPRPARRKR